MLNSYGVNRVFYLDEYLLRYTQNKNGKYIKFFNGYVILQRAVYQNVIREIINYDTGPHALADRHHCVD